MTRCHAAFDVTFVTRSLVFLRGKQLEHVTLRAPSVTSTQGKRARLNLAVTQTKDRILAAEREVICLSH